jgi:hypothetical protein
MMEVMPYLSLEVVGWKRLLLLLDETLILSAII